MAGSHTPRSVRRALLALVVAVGLLLPGSAALASPVSSGALAGSATPAATLAWKACDGKDLAGFECATLTVPLAWADASSGTMALAVARHRSTGPASRRIGSLFFNPGGPGLGGVSVLPTIWKMLPSAAKARFDLVTWDPRGMGGSSGLVGCVQVAMPLPPTGPVDWPAVYAQARDARAAENARCAERNATIVAHMGTMAVVHDLDSLRAAVGDPKITYWGMSYGTRIGYAYALTFPDRIRAIVLDGNIDPSSSIVDLAGSGTAKDTALGYFFELYPTAAAQYRRVHEALQARTVPLPSGAEMTRWNLDLLLDSAAGGESGYALLAEVIGAADTATFGSGAAAAKAARLLDSVDLAKTVDMSGPSFAFVNCIDYADRPTPAEQDAVARSVRLRGPVAGWFEGYEIVSMCAGLNVPTDPVPIEFPSDWGAKLLLVGSTRDAATPYAWTANMATAFRASRVVTYVGAKHVVYGLGMSPCVNAYVTAYFVDLARPARDVGCPGVAKAAG